MGGYILCHEKKASKPYSIEAVGMKLWTIEELCYYISHYVWLLDGSFLCEELCEWVDRELQMPKLARQMYAEYYRGKSLKSFIEIVLNNTGYCSRSEIDRLLKFLDGMEHVSEMERLKQKGDYFLKDHKYRRAIGMYNQILTMKRNRELSPSFYSGVLNNKGMAYAGLFLFDETCACMKAAWQEEKTDASERAFLGALYLHIPETEFRKRAEFEGLEQDKVWAFLMEAEKISSEKSYRSVLSMKREYEHENQ